MLFILEDNQDRIDGFAECLGEAPFHVENVVPESIRWLQANMERVSFYSLDNDLYVPAYEGDEGEGRYLCDWILANCPKKPIIVHSTNSHASTCMELACKDADWEFHRVVPYDGFVWIPETWIHVVRAVKRTLS